MARRSAEYGQVREKMEPGDVIAFGGKGAFSDVIKWATRCTVSHVGVIMRSVRVDATHDGFFNQIIESTSLDGFNGVQVTKLSKRLDHYNGEVWWLPLSEEVRGRLDGDAFFDFLMENRGKEYDMPQAVLSAIDALGPFTRNAEDFSRFFCSELVSAALEVGGVVRGINASEITPIDLCRWNIFEKHYYQLKGNMKEITGYNRLDPQAWS